MISISKQVGKKPEHYEKITEIIIKYELNERDSSQRYIYHNVPTCDGTSIVKALSEHFNLEQYCLEQSYPDWENEGSKLLIFLRDPWELQISLYDNEIRLGTISVDEPIRDRLFLRKNFMANLLKCNDSNYLSVLRQYFFIGIVENFQESFDRLSLLTGKPEVTLEKYNDSPLNRANFDANLISDFKEANQLDYKIYDYARSFYG